MAKTFISPGVFTEEIDESFLAQGVESIGAALVGLAEKGPAFVPVRVKSFSEYAELYGSLNSDFVLSYAAKAYLKNSAGANIVRVLGPAGRTANGAAVNPGWTAQSMWGVVASGTGSAGRLHAIIEITGSADLVINDLTNDQFDLRISASTDGGFNPNIHVTASFNTGSANYIKKLLNTDPTKFVEKGYYLKTVYDYAFKFLTGALGAAVYSSSSLGTMTSFVRGYNSASTPWIKSQEFGGNAEYNLFRVHTLGHGKIENGRFKVSVSNVKISPVPTVSEFGTFTLTVRDFVDSDTVPSIVASFENLDLNSKSRNYILKRVGNQYWEYDATNDKMVLRGDYPVPADNKFVRIELITGSYPDSALPWGFRGLAKPDLTLNSGSILGLESRVSSSIHDLPYVPNLYKDKYSGPAEAGESLYWGMETTLSGSVTSRFTWMPTMTGSDVDFSLKWVSGSDATATVGAGNQGLRYANNGQNDGVALLAGSQKLPGTTTSHTVLEPKHARFTIPLAFGFDGWNATLALSPIDNDAQLAATTQLGVQALREAIDVVKDPDFIDINLLAIPGVFSDQVVEYGIEKIESRADAMYVIDISGSTPKNVADEVKGRAFNTSYAAVYYPDINLVDDVNGKIVRVPSSVAAVGAISFNDRVAFPWYAPAGLNRGGLNIDTIGFTVTRPADQLKESERDTLYENRINPIAKFPGIPGAVIWGQKTLQVKASALDRINVRRLLIKAKKLISSATRFLVFDPNNASSWTAFKQMVNPILADMQMKNGLEQFKIVMDSSTNTPELIDRNVMSGKILLVPTKSAEYISISFVIGRSGAVFEE